MVPNADMDALFEATVEATEEAIINAMVAAETMTGRDGVTAHALPHDRLQDVLREYDRYVDPQSLPRAAEVNAADLEPLVGVYRGNGPFGEARLYLENEALYLDIGGSRRRAVRLTDGRMLLLGTGGMELDATPAEAPSRLRLVQNGQVVAELDRAEEE